VRGSPDAAMHRRRLLRELRRARKGAGLSQKQVADDLGWSISKLLRIENGQVSVSKTDLRALLELYQIADAQQVHEFEDMARLGRYQPWSPYGDVLNKDFITYLGFEGAASTIRQYEPVFVPGLLQTEDYARMVIRRLAGQSMPAAVIERQVETRLLRQALLEQPGPPTMLVILDEAVVRRCLGGDAEAAGVMRRQLEKLEELESRPNIEISVVPFSAGFHPRMFIPFVILEFPDPEDDDLLYVEDGKRSVATRDNADEITRHKAMFWDLQEATSSVSLHDMITRVTNDGS